MNEGLELGSALGFDPRQLKQKYADERDKRLRKDGKAQYCAAAEHRPDMLSDPFDKAPFTRAPMTEEIDVLIVGAGMSGLMTAATLRKNGVNSLRIIDGASDFGGTWYYNRYPGAQCDTEAYIYMPWLDETGYVPTEKYARGPELFAYFQQFGRQFELYERTFFKTLVKTLRWDETAHRWIVATDNGDEIRARFISLSTGSLAVPKLPGVPGLGTFGGHSFLTSRWDYDYTGGTPEDATLDRLTDKRVAIIGTGCTAIQAAPQLAKWAEHLFVFQRTPSMINYRGNRSTDPEWARTLKPGWQKERSDNFETCVIDPSQVEVDLVADGWTTLARTLSDVGQLKALLGNADAAELAQLADYVTMENNRTRVDEQIADPAVAELLKPYYNVHCKRPTFHDEFLPTFNQANVTLIDTGGKGVERITERGIVVGGREYQVDCIVFATGFEALGFFFRTGGFTVTGTGGQSLEDKWSGPFRSLHGVFTHGFPNMAVVGQIRDGGGSFNATCPFSMQAIHVGELFARLLRDGKTRFETTREAEEDWARIMQEKMPPTAAFLAECTPGYLNNEGNTDEPALRTALYGGGVLEYERILETWRTEGVERDAVVS